MATRRPKVVGVAVALLGSSTVAACQTPVHGFYSFTVSGRVISGHPNCVQSAGSFSGKGMACFSGPVGAPGDCVAVTTHNGTDVEVRGGMPMWPVVGVKSDRNC